MASSSRTRWGSTGYRIQMASYRRRVTLALSAVVPLLVHLSGDDAFNLPKAVAVVVGASILLALLLREWVTRGLIVLAPKWASIAMGAFVVAVLVATATTGMAGDAVVGAGRRYTGALLYFSVVIVALSVATDFLPRDLRSLVRAIVVGGGLVAVYGLVQIVGLDPASWRGGSGTASTLGNPNFLSGYMAIVTVLGGWMALDRDQRLTWRLSGGGVSLLSVAALLGAASVQGFVALAGGLLAMGMLWLTAPKEGTWKPMYGLAAVLGVIAVGGGLAVLLGLDPTAAVRGGALQRGVGARVDLAQTGWAIWRDHPVLGVGMDQFGSFVRQYRPQGLAEQVSLQWTANEAHSVPVNMLANGGLVLAIPYLAAMAMPFVLAWRGMRDGNADRRLLAGMAGAFSAYLIQAAVSVDVPALALTGWVLAGGVLVASGAPPWRLSLPGPSRRVPTAVRVAGTAVGAAAVLLALIGGLQMLDADRQIRRSKAARNAEVPKVAVAAAESATSQVGWWPEYWLVLGQAHEAAGNTEAAMAALQAGYERDPRNFAILLSMARFSAAHDGDPTVWYERALAADPYAAEELAEEATPFLDGGDAS